MEIKENEFIRTKTGKIDKVINNNYYMSQYIECEKRIVEKENIVKHIFNIINLIEINDIVNESLVVDLYKILKDINKPEEGMTEIIYLENGQEINKSNEIKTILTHEQYERNCYKAKEK